MSSEHDLPRSVIRRVVISKVPGAGGEDKKFSVNKESLTAYSESAKVFISYLGTTASDVARESKRQTISAEDVVKALEELEFSELVPELREFMETYRKLNKEKSKKRGETAKANKKRKADEEKAGGSGAGGAAEETAAPVAGEAEGEQEEAAMEE